MAAKRIAGSTIDWVAFASRVPEAQKPMFNSFKSKSDGYLRKMLALPESVPKIDFAAYKGRIAVPGMVEEFQKQYEALKIPYPADTVSSQVDELEKSTMAEVAQFVKASEAHIAQLQADLAKWEAIIPFDQMTMEEFAEAYPEQAIDFNNPTMWPHNPENQPGYQAKEGDAH